MKRILLCPDVPGWVWHQQSLGIQKYAPSGYEVEIAFQQELQNHKDDSAWLRQWDAILHWSWIDCPFLFGIRRLVTVVAHDGLRHHFVRDETGQAWMVDMLQWAGSSPQRNITGARKILPRADAVIAVNPELQEAVVKLTGQEHCEYLPAGVDHQVYQPQRKPWPDGRLKIGWCGQEAGRTKGYHWILEPLQEALGNKVEWVVNTRGHQDALTQEEMVGWYNRIDIFLCGSISEGTPSTCLEAMSCGRGVISTPVGDMPHVLAGGQSGILVPGYSNETTRVRTVEHLAEQISSLTPDQVRQMGQAARSRIAGNYTWEALVPKWLKAISG